MKSSIWLQVHETVRTPGRLVRSSLYAQIPSTFLPSSRAQPISHFSPLELNEFLLTSAITPSERLMRVRTFSF